MNARHTYLISTLVAVVLLTFGTSAALAERHDQSKHPGRAPSHASPSHASRVQATPGHASQVRANPVRANPGHASQVRANPVRANPVHAAPSRANSVHANLGHTPNHAGQAPPRYSAHGNLARSSVHSIRPGYQVRRAEAAYRHPHPIHPVHRYPAAVVVARPVFVYPPVVYDATCIRIVNPAELGVAVSYTLDGQQVFLQPGEVQTLHRRCVITFDRGNGYGLTQLVLAGGTYAFGLDSDGGWSLFRS